MFLFDGLQQGYTLGQASFEIAVIVLGSIVIGFLLGFFYHQEKTPIHWLRRNVKKLETSEEVDLSGMREKALEESGENRFDNFQRLIGIDSYAQQLLYQYGIRTYEELEQTSPAILKSILGEADDSHRNLNPVSWPLQAKISAMGNWEQLGEFQYQLIKESIS